MKFKLLLIMGIILLMGTVLLVGCSDSDETEEIETTPMPTETKTPTPSATPEPTVTVTPSPAPTETIAPSGNPIAIMSTNFGDITIELFRDKVPNTADNFVKLVNDAFYDGVVFHRISDDFMIQAGMETVEGKRKVSPYGAIDLEIHPEVRHIDGAISMARTSAPNSATSQFFICDGPVPFLDDAYAAFGVVIEGIEAVREIAAQPHDNSNPAGGGIPLEQIVINSVVIQ